MRPVAVKQLSGKAPLLGGTADGHPVPGQPLGDPAGGQLWCLLLVCPIDLRVLVRLCPQRRPVAGLGVDTWVTSQSEGYCGCEACGQWALGGQLLGESGSARHTLPGKWSAEVEFCWRRALALARWGPCNGCLVARVQANRPNRYLPTPFCAVSRRSAGCFVRSSFHSLQD